MVANAHHLEVIMSATAHRIRHYVYGVAGDLTTLIPRQSGMRGDWGCEARCSCGWETHTGGATRAFIEGEVRDHKLEVKLGLWHPPTLPSIWEVGA